MKKNRIKSHKKNGLTHKQKKYSLVFKNHFNTQKSFQHINSKIFELLKKIISTQKII